MGTASLRGAWGITQTELAVVLGCSKHSIAQHESKDRALPKHAEPWVDELDSAEPPTTTPDREDMKRALAAGQVAFWRWQSRRELLEAHPHGVADDDGALEGWERDPRQTELGDQVVDAAKQLEETGTNMWGASSVEYMDGRQVGLEGRESRNPYIEGTTKAKHWANGREVGQALRKDLEAAGMIGQGDLQTDELTDTSKAERLGMRAIREAAVALEVMAWPDDWREAVGEWPDREVAKHYRLAVATVRRKRQRMGKLEPRG